MTGVTSSCWALSLPDDPPQFLNSNRAKSNKMIARRTHHSQFQERFLSDGWRSGSLIPFQLILVKSHPISAARAIPRSQIHFENNQHMPFHINPHNAHKPIPSQYRQKSAAARTARKIKHLATVLRLYLIEIVPFHQLPSVLQEKILVMLSKFSRSSQSC